jgi:electron transport complex protein RnfG
MGIDGQGRILGVRITSHQETPGLGDKIEHRKSDWIFSFIGRSLTDPAPQAWRVKKDGGAFDQLTGATITPRAVVHAVKQGLEVFAAHRAQLLQH